MVGLLAGYTRLGNTSSRWP